MSSICDRCKRKAYVAIMSVMNEDAVCLDCLQEERKHPMYMEAKRREEQESWNGNFEYPGLFAGQKYPFGYEIITANGLTVQKEKTPLIKNPVYPKQHSELVRK